MKTAAARALLFVVSLVGAALIAGACSSDESALPDRTTDATIGSMAVDRTPAGGSARDGIASVAGQDGGAGDGDPFGVGSSAGGGVATGAGVVDPVGPRLPLEGSVTFRPGTCFEPPFPGGEPAEIACDEPHRIQVYATPQLAAEDGGPPPADVATGLCRDRFRTITGVDLGLAAGLHGSVQLPGDLGWAEGQRTATCYVVFPEQTVLALSALDPLRFADRVSIYGLQPGDCLVDLDLAATTFELLTCDEPHDGEVFAVYDFPAGPFPGPELIDSVADNLCFGQGFTDFVGVPFDRSAIDAVMSAPSEETWALGHHRIGCVVTDGLVRTGSLAAAGR